MKNKRYSITRNYESVGNFLGEMRQKANLTQREVSLKLGYSSAQFISNFERGIALPPLSKLRTLIKLYGIDPKEIMELILEAEKARMLEGLKSKSNRAVG